MKIKITLLVLVIAMSSFAAVHKFYVSVTEIEYNEQGESLQIISRVFIDDFEDVLKKRYDQSITLGERESAGVDAHIKKYLEQKLQIEVNSKPVSVNFLGKEYDNDMLVFYLEVENVEDLKTIQVKNTVLMDLYEEQKNLIHVEYQNKIQSLVLTSGKEVNQFNFIP